MTITVTARCTRCGRTEEDGARFSRRKSRATGRLILASSWCNACRAEHRRLGRARRADEVAPLPVPTALAARLRRRAAWYAVRARNVADPILRRRSLRAARDYAALAAEIEAGAAF